jgi:hypothetical protein
MSATRGRVRTLSIGAIAAIVLATAASTARASLLGSSACTGAQVAYPFTHWLDFSPYVLVPGGTFEAGTPAWTFTGSARVVAANEPWHVHSAADSLSLALWPGSSATSPTMCVAASSPTVRFFVGSSSLSLLSALRVDVIFKTTAGLINTLPIGVVPALGVWTPSLPYAFVVNILTLLNGDYSSVRLRFTPLGTASWVLDDVYVDPWSKG